MSLKHNELLNWSCVACVFRPKNPCGCCADASADHSLDSPPLLRGAQDAFTHQVSSTVSAGGRIGVVRDRCVDVLATDGVFAAEYSILRDTCTGVKR